MRLSPYLWYLRQGKQSRLLQQRSYNTGSRQNQLGQFLEGHAQISWLHNIQTGNYSEAATTLKRLSDAGAITNTIFFCVLFHNRMESVLEKMQATVDRVPFFLHNLGRDG